MPSFLTRRSLVAAPLLAALAFGGLTACETGRRLSAPEQRAAAAPIDHDAWSALGYRLEWRGFPTMSARGQVRFFEPLVSEGSELIAVQESTSVLSVLEDQSGATRWSDELATPLTRFVGIIHDPDTSSGPGGRTISSSETEVFYKANDTGTLVNKHGLDRVVNTRPLLAGNVLVYGTTSGEVVGYLKDRGFRLWGNSVRGSIETDPIFVGALAAVVSQQGDVLFFDPVSGLGTARNAIAGGIAPGVRLAASDSTAYIASLDQSLYAFDARTGSLLWRKRTGHPLTTSPAYHDGRVYMDIPGQGMTAFDARTGREAWSNPDITGDVIAMRNGRLVAWDRRTRTAATLDPDRGDTVERVTLDNVQFIRTDRFADGNIYICSSTGVVSKFIPR